MSSISPIASAREDDGPGGPQPKPTPQTTPAHTTPYYTTPYHTTPGTPASTKPATQASSGSTGSATRGTHADDPEPTDTSGSSGGPPSNPGPSGPSGPTIIQYICQCTHDPEQQFYPTVGTLNSINTSIDLVDVFADKESSGAAWTPSLVELPGIGDTIANTYKYGVLYTGAWDTPAVDNKSDHSIKVKGENGDEDCLFWPSWPYAPRIQLSHSNEDKNTNVFGKTTDSEDEIRLHGTVSTSPEGDYVQKTYYDEEKGVIVDKPYLESATPYVEPEPPKDEDSEDDSSPIPRLQLSGDSADDKSTTEKDKEDDKPKTEVFSLWTYDTWQDTQDVYTSNAQYSAYMSDILKSTNLSEDAKRALNILGYDILYRDEYITRIHEDRYWSFGYYYDSMLDTYINQETKKVTKNPLTQDYIVQCLYRVMGQENVETSLFFFCDAKLAVDFSPIAETLTVSVDKVNEAQNRVDAFVTRCNLDEYWKRAVDEGLVKETGDTTYVISNLKKAPNVQSITVDGKSHVVAADEENDPIIVDTARRQQLTVAEFCELAYKFMNAYGEEVMTDQEQELLLVTYGSKLPYGIVTDNQMIAIKYLMAKGIVSSDTVWDEYLTIDSLLTLLMRIKDKDSRLTFKEVSITYDADLVKQGNYPAEITISNDSGINVTDIEITNSFDLSDVQYIDYFLKVSNNVTSYKNGKEFTIPSTRFANYESDGTYAYSENLCLMKKGSGGYIGENSGAEYDTSPIHDYEYVVLSDNATYLHIQIYANAIFETTKDGQINYSKFNSDYVNDNNCFILNTTDHDAVPEYYRVSAYGGVYSKPKISVFGRESSGSDTCSVLYTSEEADPSNMSVSYFKKTWENNEGPCVNNTEELEEALGVNHVVVKVNKDGHVTEGYGTKVTIKKNYDNYSSFYDMSVDNKFYDHRRILELHALGLARNAYLSSNEEKKDPSFVDKMGGIIPRYDLKITVQSDPTDGTILYDDLYYGEELLVDKSKPSEVKSISANVEVEYLSKIDNTYTYVFRGAQSVDSIKTSLRFKGASYTGEVFVGYVKDNETFMIPVSSLVKFVTDYHSEEGDYGELTGGKWTELSEDVLLISFDWGLSGNKADSIPFDIVLDNKRNLVSINNIVYQIPADKGEKAFIKLSSEGYSDYYINWRAVSGWSSGYSVSVSQSGTITIDAKPIPEDGFEYKQYANLYSNLSFQVSAATGDNIPALRIAYPNIMATYMIFYSADQGTYLITAKCNDTKCPDSHYARISEEAKKYYALGPLIVDGYFGHSLASSDYLISCMELSGTEVNFDGGDRLVLDSNLGEWLYYPRVFSDKTLNDFLPNKSALEYDDNMDTIPWRSEIVMQYIEQATQDYYEGKQALPIVLDANRTTFLDFTSNLYENCPYGSTPSWALNSDALGYWRGFYTNTSGTDKMAQLIVLPNVPYNSIETSTNIYANNVNTIVAPVSLTASLMLENRYTLSDLSKMSGNNTWGLWGNTRVKLTDDGQLLPASQMECGLSQEFSQDVQLIAASATRQWISVGNVYLTKTDSYDKITDKVAQAKLGDAEQPTYVDWDKYSFDTLIHDIDNGMTIVLIIVLNIIPRIAVFLFLLLIALATISNIKPWKNFCHKYIDLYKILTFGHKNVDTVDARWLLISSMIGMAVFLLFMDGTIINVLTWLVQNVGKLIVR